MTEHGWPEWPDDEHGGARPHDDGPPPGPDPHDPVAGPGHPWPDSAAWDHTDLPEAEAEAPHAGGPEQGESAHGESGHGARGGGADPWAPEPAALSDTHDTVVPDLAQAWDHDVSSETHTTGYGMGSVGTDPDAVDGDHGPADVFPPAVDVGALPEPVDGFPWIDTGSLGVVPADDGAQHAAGPAPDSADLAGYAAVDLPPGVDPWAHLAASDDPAISALARFWNPEQ